MRKKILVTLPMTKEDKQKIKQIGKDCSFVFKNLNKLTSEDVKNTHVIIGNVKPKLLEEAERLEWIQLNSAGYDQYVGSPYLKKNVILTNAGGAYGVSVSEHLLALVTTVSKKLHLYRDSQQMHLWSDHGLTRPLHDQTVLVLGLGDIGNKFAKMMNDLGNKVIGIVSTLREAPAYVDGLYLLEDLQSILPLADIVVNCLPLTRETRNLFSQDQFAIMKKSALFFNVGRGESVDTNALIDAVEKRIIAGAGIDVMDPEPLPKDHPLWKVKDILITPHCAGGFHLQSTLDRIKDIVYDNLNSYVKGEEFKNRIL